MGFKATGEKHPWPWLKRVAMFFDAFFILHDGLSYVQHGVDERPGRTSPLTPKIAFLRPAINT